MLKKIMIICLAFSFVFIGGIAFASGNGPEEIKESQELTRSSGDVAPPADPTDLITDDSKTLVEEGVELTEEGVELTEEGVGLKDKVIDLKDEVVK